jgi:DNA repair exonuclease SbcCD nuclease subunit
MLRFIHTSDLHLGKRFGQFPEELRGRLTEARHNSLGRLISLAQSQDANFILVAGDVYDTGTPSPAIIRQSMRAMGENPSILWILLPGNHDSLASDELWKQVAADRPDNVLLALKNEPIELEPSTFILPAPCINRRPGRDLTEWMQDSSVPSDSIRIGIAHGAIYSFGEEGASDVIAPDRAMRDGLDYLALGDWHGQVQVNDRTWYSGTPEPDRFKHGLPGKALAVSIDGPGAMPQVEPFETGSFNWKSTILSMLPGDDVGARLSEILPEIKFRRNELLRIIIEGRIRLPERLALEGVLKKVTPDFAWMEVRSEDLQNEYIGEDLDNIDQAGVLRQVAEDLLREAQFDGDPHNASAAALSLLYSFAVDEA